MNHKVVVSESTSASVECFMEAWFLLTRCCRDYEIHPDLLQYALQLGKGGGEI